MASTEVSSPSGIPESFEHVETLGGIQSYRHTTNGLEVLILPESAAPVATFMVTYRVGSRHEPMGLTGATHFLEHLMFKGTERFHKSKGTSIFNVLQSVGAKVNASTWVDRTNYYEMLPREHLPLAVEIEADRMRGALLDPEDVESERTVILNEYDRGRNESTSRLFDEVWATAFLAHPYRHPTIGWRSDIEGVDDSGLRHFYDQYYWPNNATVSIIGDVDPAEALTLVDQHFGDIPRSEHEITSPSVREPEQSGPRRLEVRQEGQLGAVLQAYKTPDGRDDDAEALDVLGRILASGKGSRLFRRCTDRGLTTDAYAINFRLRDPGLFCILTFLAPDKTHDVVEEAVEEVVQEVQENGVTEEEVRRAQTQIRASEAFDRDGPMKVASQLNEAIATGDWRLYVEYPDRIDAVTPEDVQRVARTYLLDDRLTVGRYVPTAPPEATNGAQVAQAAAGPVT
ncbi:peptidase M16 [Longibacter salinarum]|uniref:Peptidase M16 n=1 Tax=Longibacter salinarum TaxID=1850348 RepID=A0A2A8D307_9BACT|nr:pitrilysin family protein [Longibacter salinarum]PEN15270.1 peptidase M16 [Longibacter salinarum]